MMTEVLLARFYTLLVALTDVTLEREHRFWLTAGGYSLSW